MKNLENFDLEAMASQSSKKDNVKNYAVKLVNVIASLQAEKVVETTETVSLKEKCMHCHQEFDPDLGYNCPVLAKNFPVWMKTPHQSHYGQPNQPKKKPMEIAETPVQSIIVLKETDEQKNQETIKHTPNTENKCIFCNHTVDEDNAAPKCEQHPNTSHKPVCLNCYLGPVSGSPKYYC